MKGTEQADAALLPPPCLSATEMFGETTVIDGTEADPKAAVSASSQPMDGTHEVIALFDTHHQAIFSYLYRMVDGDRSLAEELTQETFLKIFEAREQLPHIRNRRAWLYRIATNLALNAQKRRRRFRWLPWARGMTVQESRDGMADADLRLDLEQALEKLPSSLRAPLLLSVVQGLSSQEIAEALRISPGAVRTRIYRAREQLRHLLQEEV